MIDRNLNAIPTSAHISATLPGAAPKAQTNTELRVKEREIVFPLVSSHMHGDTIKSVGLYVSPHGAGFVHCDEMPNRMPFGAERTGPFIAAIHRNMLRTLGTKETQRKVAEAFCVRARKGDQNAMGMIAMVRESAMAGSPKAKQAFRFMEDFVKRNPVTPNIGDDEITVRFCVKYDPNSAVALANGPPISSSRIRSSAASFKGYDRDIFLDGIRKWQCQHDKDHGEYIQRLGLDQLQQDILKAGRTVGMARAIQKIKNIPDIPIAVYSEAAAWELGE